MKNRVSFKYFVTDYRKLALTVKITTIKIKNRSIYERNEKKYRKKPRAAALATTFKINVKLTK